MADIFDENTQANIFDQIVGEGKKFADPESLARGKVEADRTIEDRNRELSEYRQEMARLREELELTKSQIRAPTQATDPSRDTTQPVEEPIDLATRIREELERRTEEDKKTQNLNEAVAKLNTLYGEKAGEVLRTKAQELGVPVQWLKDQAAASPKAFYATLGLDDHTTSNVSTVRGDVNTERLADIQTSTAVKSGTYKWYDALRKENPKQYFTAEVQNRMFADAKRLGDAFYS